MTSGHVLVHLLHPLSGRRREGAAIDLIRADTVTEHALHFDGGQIDCARVVAVVREAERIDGRIEAAADRTGSKSRTGLGCSLTGSLVIALEALVENEAIGIDALVRNLTAFPAIVERLIIGEALGRDGQRLGRV